MTVIQMQEAILKAYPGNAWKKKVEKMKAGQIMAVYQNFLHSGKLDKK